MYKKFALLFVVMTIAQSAGASAQAEVDRKSVVVVAVGESFLTAWGHVNRTGAAEYQRDLTKMLGVRASVSYSHRDARDDWDLLSSDSNWGLRRHARASIGAVVTPIRLRIGGVESRIGLVAGVAVRHVSDQIFFAFRGPFFFASSPPGFRDYMRSELESVGYIIRTIDYDDGAGGLEDGQYLFAIRPNSDTQPGAELGLRYEARIDRLVLGVDASYTRYLNQGLAIGSHSGDVAMRIGYRF